MRGPGKSAGIAAGPVGAFTERAARFWTDETVARRVADGDSNAFAEMYRRFHQPVFRYCCSILRNEDDARDALQNTMAKAIKSLPGEKRDLRLQPWLMRVARNECLDMLRASKRHADVDEIEPTSRVDVASSAESRERLRILLTDIEQLPERQRSALVMRELNGLSFDDIAGALGTTSEVSRQTVYEARIALQDLEKGRMTPCHTVRGAVSGGDRRVLRGRALKSHLRGCRECRDFNAGIQERTQTFRSTVPVLPSAAAASVFGSINNTGLSEGAGGLLGLFSSAGAVGAGTKAVSVVAAVGIGAGVVGVTGELRSREAPDRPVRTEVLSQRAAATSTGPAQGSPAARRPDAGSAGGRRAGRASRNSRPRSDSPSQSRPSGVPSGSTPVPETLPPAPGGAASDQGVAGPGTTADPVTVPPVKLPPVRVPDLPVDLPEVKVPPVNVPEVQVPPLDLPVKPNLDSITK